MVFDSSFSFPSSQAIKLVLMAIARSIGKSSNGCKFEINFFIRNKMDSIVSSKNQQHQ